MWLTVPGMYSLYHPVLADTQSSSSSAGVGYQVLAAASDGQLTLTEIAPSAITPTNDISTHVITPKLEKTEEDDDDVSAQEFYEVPATSELAATNLEMIVECAGTT